MENNQCAECSGTGGSKDYTMTSLSDEMSRITQVMSVERCRDLLEAIADHTIGTGDFAERELNLCVDSGLANKGLGRSSRPIYVGTTTPIGEVPMQELPMGLTSKGQEMLTLLEEWLRRGRQLPHSC